jgi:hypothetical protein
MAGVFEYYNNLQGVRTRLTGLPGWARLMLFIAALPGIALVALSILAFLVSLAALLLLTLPLYRVLKWVTGTGGESDEQTQAIIDPFEGERRKRVDATVVE